jgi:hypothetical protein
MLLKDVFNEKYEWEDVNIERLADSEAWVVVSDGKIVFGETAQLSLEEAKIFALKLAKNVHWEN